MVSKQIMFLHTCTVVKVRGACTVLQRDKVCRRWRRLNLQTPMFTSNVQYFFYLRNILHLVLILS